MATILGIINGLIEIVNLFKQAWALYQQAKVEGWIQEGKKIADGITNAKTDEERKALVKKLADSIHGIPL